MTSERSLVVGGVPAAKAIPFAASIQVLEKGVWYHVCGASLVSKDFVLSAAQCANLMASYDTRRVVVGALNVEQLDANPAGSYEVRSITAMNIHPAFELADKPFQIKYDVALFRLESPIETIKPVRINTDDSSQESAGKSFVVAGWGSTVIDGPNSATLKEVQLPILDLLTCNMSYGIVQDHSFCSLMEDGDVCTNDQGSPAFTKGCDGSALQLGIVSYGDSASCTSGNPSVFMSTRDVSSWIHATTGYSQPRPVCEGVSSSPTTSQVDGQGSLSVGAIIGIVISSLVGLLFLVLVVLFLLQKQKHSQREVEDRNEDKKSSSPRDAEVVQADSFSSPRDADVVQAESFSINQT